MPAAEEPQPINLYRLGEFSGDNKEFAIELGDLFLSDSARIIAQLGVLLDDDNRGQLCREAHKLKGSTANLGACSLSQMAGELEKQAMASEKSELKSRLELLNEEFTRVCEQLRNHLNALRSEK